MYGELDTIAGISTAIGNGGIAIIRISGENSIKVIKKIFSRKLTNFESHKVYYGTILDANDVVLDEVLVTIMLAPKTYTCEDVVEINCHGGIKTVNRVLEEVVKHDVRLAQAGEFTKRAFLNGRIDLVQAEAIIDVINAKTEISRQASVNQLSGELSQKIKKYRQDLLILLAHIEASIDYPEHDEQEQNLQNILIKSQNILNQIHKLISTFDKGKIIKNGIETAIVGRPNVGKSSLLNILLNEERAIVTDIQGTTRDTLSEYITINNILLKLTDTAGIRQTEDEIEKIGIQKSLNCIKNSDLILVLIDSSSEISIQDIEILEQSKNKKTIIILNKIDLEQKADVNILKKYVESDFLIEISILNKIGINNLEKALEKMFFDGELGKDDEIIITSLRHKTSLIKATESIKNVIKSIENGYTEDIVAIDLQDGYSYLGEILGESIGEELLDMIFSEFCLGK